MSESTGGERRPRGKEWRSVPHGLPWDRSVICVSGWKLGPLKVVSTLEMAEAPDGTKETVAQWHISISSDGRRAKAHEVRRVLRAFGLVGAEEDNHHPGVARNFWLPLDPARRVDCECKTEEETVVDPDGYRWQNTRAGVCRGCEYERDFGKPCPLHPKETAV